MNTDEIKYSLENLRKRKLRSFLTVLSILMGIASVFALVSFGEGIRYYVDNMADTAGRNKFFIQSKGIGAPGTDSTFYISKDDIEFVSKIKGVSEIAGLYASVIQVTYKGQTKYTYMISLDPKKIDFISEAFGADVYKGRRLKEGDLTKVALGYNYQFPDKFLKEALKIGDKIELNGERFEVVAFLEEIGNPSDDSQVYVIPEAVESLYPNIKDKFAMGLGQTQQGENTKEIADKIEEKLRKHKGQKEGKEDFYVQTFEDALQTFSIVIDVINGILVLISLISLVVAAVNIMNTMYTATLERTKEIGVLKAVGARNSKILKIFVFESGLLGLVGGIIGVLLGWMVASIGGSIAAASGFSMLKPIYPLWLIIGCIFFSVCIGAGSGLLPAWQASKLRPVDALRYE